MNKGKKRYTLQKKERLKGLKTIDALFKNGKRFTVLPLRVFYSLTDEGVRFGAGVSKRNFKKAVDRNRIKRMMREVYRLQKNELLALMEERKSGINLFFIYTEKEIPDYRHLYTKMQKALEKVIVSINENNNKAS